MLSVRGGIQQRPKVTKHTFCYLVVPHVCCDGLLHVFDGVLWVTLFCQVVVLYMIVLIYVYYYRACHYRQQCHCQVLVVLCLAYNSSLSHHVCCIAKESHIILLIGSFQIFSV